MHVAGLGLAVPTQVITLTIPTDAIAEDERPELALELIRAANAVLAAKIPNRDSLQGIVSKWVEK